MAPITFAILTVSDTCSRNPEVKDESGAVLKELIHNTYDISSDYQGKVVRSEIIPDELPFITDTLAEWCDKSVANVILTTGGTGCSRSDVTPEATKTVIHKETPGLSIAMLMESLKITPMAMLSRAVCGIRWQTLIINLPGSPKAAVECFNVVAKAIPHAVDLILNNKAKIKSTHDIVQSDTHDIVPQSSTCSRNKSRTNTFQANSKNVAERPRESPFPMISVEDAVQKIFDNIRKELDEGDRIKITDAYGRVLIDDVFSSYNLPPFRASIKDGYAVLASDGKGRRKVLCAVKAGASNIKVNLVSGTCVRVNTGAPIPDEATAVVQVEDTKLVSKTSDNTEEEEIEIMIEPKERQDIRPIGSDIPKGTLILEKDTCIGVVEMGLLAACGINKISVKRRPSIGILSTGDELEEHGRVLEWGHVYDSNRITLISLLKENNFDTLDLGIAVDDKTAIIEKIEKNIEKIDVLVTTGSVSMGDRDLLKDILENHFKASIRFGRVNMKPGKPTTFATCYFKNKKKYFLCLPGNPVSAFVTAHLFLLPLLRRMQSEISEPLVVVAKTSSDYTLDERPEYVRAILKSDPMETYPTVFITGNQISSNLLNCKRANALLKLPQQTTNRQMLHKNDLVSAILISKMVYK